MEFGDQPLNFTLVAAVAVPQYHIVTGSGDGYGGLSVTTSMCIGVCQNTPLVGELMTVCPLGKTKVYVSSAVTAWQRVTSGLSGRAIPAGSGDSFIGVALHTAAIGDVVTILAGLGGQNMGAL